MAFNFDEFFLPFLMIVIISAGSSLASIINSKARKTYKTPLSIIADFLSFFIGGLIFGLFSSGFLENLLVVAGFTCVGALTGSEFIKKFAPRLLLLFIGKRLGGSEETINDILDDCEEEQRKEENAIDKKDEA